MPEAWQLAQMQGLPLELKVKKTVLRIREWYEAWDGDVYTSFSGGIDSTVLKDIVDGMGLNIPSVFVDTGLEYPEVRNFARSQSNVTVLHPSMNFRKVIMEYGYPVVSKEVAQVVREAKIGLERILRRSEKRGKPLPPLLKEVLERQAGLSPTPSKSEADVLGGEGRLNSGGPVCDPGNEQRSIPVPTTVSSPGIRVQSGSVREGPGHRVGGGDIPDSGSQYVGDRTDSVLPDAFAIENHPQDCRVKLSEDGTVQTLAARMGTGGGNTPIVLQSCSGRSSTGAMSREK